MSHILFKNILKFKARKEPIPPLEYVYNYTLGAWVNSIDKTLLVTSPSFQRVATKKFDVETGEDHKSQ